MKKQIIRAFVLIGISAAFLCSVIVFFVLQISANRQMEMYVTSTGQMMAQVFNSSDISVDELNLLHKDNLRLTWIAQDGTILFDTASATQNHADRPEFIQALEFGYGEATRLSGTLRTETFYSANLLSDGSVLRISASRSSVWSHVFSLVPVLIIVFIIVVIISAVLSNLFTKKIMLPIENINVQQPLINDTYDEFTPLLRKINDQNIQLQAKLLEVQTMRDELSEIMKSMAEGLIVVNENGLVLSVNESALNILECEQTPKKFIGEPLLSLHRGDVFIELTNACEKRENLQTELTINGRIYRLMLSQAPKGAIVLIVDETEKCESEKMRREFSANVSHELKTPLQAILGYAELLSNNLVNEKDKPTFYENIYKDCQRLTFLVQDIIHLSHLDEGGGNIAKESVDLYDVAQNIVSEFKNKAQKKQVSISVIGENAHISAVPALVYEMIYNLVDNAIAYNKQNGEVIIEIEKHEHAVSLIVKDNGIGIPEEHQARVFERFYRVDKSHSRSTGGTGLGLSIVKHAAQVHGAQLNLQSKEASGTVIEILFNK